MAEAILDGLDGAIVEFCRFARANGLLAGVKESLGALEAAKTAGIADREILKTSLRAVLCSSKADWDLFEELFESFWTSAKRPFNSFVKNAVRLRTSFRHRKKLD